MANTIRFKRRTSGGLAGAPSSLATSEPAFNEADNTLYLGYGDNGSGVATSVVAVAGKGAFADLSSTQTIGGTKTFSNSPVIPTPDSSDNSTKAASTAYVKGQGYITGNQSITLSGDISGSGTTAITGTLATVNSNVGTYTKVTVNGKGLVTAAENLSASDVPTLSASKISDFDTQVRTSRLDQMAAPTASVSLNSQKITGLADPTGAQDAATKNYVDTVSQGLDPKASARAATTANVASLSGTLTIDGVSLNADERVLVKNQSSASENGIYVVKSGSWVRADDANSWGELVSAYVFVEEGTTNADNGYLCTVDAGGTLDSTSVTFVQFTGAGQVIAGDGLTKSGNQIDVVGTADRITANANSIDIASTYVGQTSITTLGTIGTGVWQGTAVAVGYGGLGLTSAITGLLKGNGSAYSAATAGTDYLDPSSTIDGGTF